MKSFTTLTLLTLLPLTLSQPTNAPATIFDTLAVHANNQTSTEGARFSTLYGYMQSISDVGDLLKENKDKKRVIFAPTDEAFRKLNRSDPSGFGGLVGNQGLLTNVLKYHILDDDENFNADAVSSAYRGFYQTELDGQPIRTDIDASHAITLSNGLNSTKTLAPIPAANGVIYPIDDVLVPPYGASRVLAAKDSTSSLRQMVQQYNYTDTLSKLQHVTILAPNNDAFNALRGRNDVNLTTALATSALNLHIIPRVVYSTHIIPSTAPALSAPVQVPTALENTQVTVSNDGKDIFVAGPGNKSPAKVVERDILFAGGVIHIIDQVLLPNANPDGTVANVGNGQPATQPVQPDLDSDNQAKGPLNGGGDVSNQSGGDGNSLVGLEQNGAGEVVRGSSMGILLAGAASVFVLL